MQMYHLIKKYLAVLVISFLFFSCGSNNSEFIEPLKYTIAQELYWNNSLADSFRDKVGQKYNFTVYKTVEENYLGNNIEHFKMVLPEIKFSDEKLQIDFYKTNDLVFSGYRRAVDLDEKQRIGNFEIEIPKDWKAIGSIFDGTYEERNGVIKTALMSIVKSRTKDKKATIYIGPFTKYSNCMRVIWVEGKKAFVIMLADDETLKNAVEMQTKEKPYDEAGQVFIDNCMKDGKKIILDIS